MRESSEKNKDWRISQEFSQLKKLLKDIPKDKFKAAEGLMQRAAFMRINLEELEKDINENGTMEMFSQTKDVEYERERPATRIYNATVKNYQAICRQLFDMLPQETAKVEADELMGFVKRAK
jgi:hypothetical protein